MGLAAPLARGLDWLTSGARVSFLLVVTLQHSLYVCLHERKWLTALALSLLVLMQHGWAPIAQARGEPAP